jgi:hypothetical protein
MAWASVGKCPSTRDPRARAGDSNNTPVNEREGHEYTASLRVSSERLKLAELEARLGTPTEGHDIGDPASQKRPDVAKYRHAQLAARRLQHRHLLRPLQLRRRSRRVHDRAVAKPTS